MNQYIKQLSIVIIFLSSSQAFSQVYTTWDAVETKRFGKEVIYSSAEDGKPLNGDYKLSESSGAYAEVTFKNGKIEGSYISYDFVGNKMSEANYKAGKVDGKYSSYFQDGKIEEENFYKNGLRNGKWLTYNKKGEVLRTEVYKNDKKEGEWTRTLRNPIENTISIVKESYKDNKPVGKWEERLTDGKLKWEQTYSSPTDYVKKYFYPNGKLKEERRVKDRKKNGFSKFYTPEEILLNKINYNEDHIVYKEAYFENGILESKTNYKYGSINGLFEEYTEEGVKIIEGNYKDTYKDGLWKRYDKKKGRLSSEITYKNDKENGIAKFYDIQSKRMNLEGHYLSGKQHGLWKHYDPAGELVKEVEYNKGKKISEKTFN